MQGAYPGAAKVAKCFGHLFLQMRKNHGKKI
jgi:hypothetical protein